MGPYSELDLKKKKKNTICWNSRLCFCSPLAYSLIPAKRTTNGQNLQDHAHALWGLLPAFCQYPTDLYQNIGSLVEVLVKFLKEDPSMHENVSISLQVITISLFRI